MSVVVVVVTEAGYTGVVAAAADAGRDYVVSASCLARSTVAVVVVELVAKRHLGPGMGRP